MTSHPEEIPYGSDVLSSKMALLASGLFPCGWGSVAGLDTLNHPVNSPGALSNPPCIGIWLKCVFCDPHNAIMHVGGESVDLP